VSTWVSRGGDKLSAAFQAWRSVIPALEGSVAADLGSNVGGFVQCLLAQGITRVYAIDTGYGVLAWELRKDPRVRVMERTNALHVVLPEKVDLVTIDVAWTRQRLIIPAAFRLLRDGGLVVTLVKPQYEATRKERRGGVLPRESVSEVLSRVRTEVRSVDGEILAELESPIKGAGGNTEFLWLVRSGSSTSEIRC